MQHITHNSCACEDICFKTFLKVLDNVDIRSLDVKHD